MVNGIDGKKTPTSFRETTAEVEKRLSRNLLVRRSLPGNGRLKVDRQLPFLCIYREPKHPDLGTRELVTSEAAYLFVSGAATEKSDFTTTRLAMTAVNMGHHTFTLGVGNFVYTPDGSIYAHAKTPRATSYDSLKKFMADIQDDENESQRISVDELDVLLLRNDPAEDAADRVWAQTSGILFGQLAVILDLERKARYKQYYGSQICNVHIATL